MNKIILICCFLGVIASPAIAQKHDYTWPLGFGTYWHGTYPQGDTFYTVTQGGQILNFNHEPPSIHLQNSPVSPPLAAISNSNGLLIAYTDGCAVSDRAFKLMKNSLPFNAGSVHNSQCGPDSFPNWNYPVYQGMLFLPKPADSSRYYLLHLFMEVLSPNCHELRYTQIGTAGADTIESVTEINQLLVADDTLGTYMTATKHANGRDWWIVTPNHRKSRYHISLLSPNGLDYIAKQSIGEGPLDQLEWGGQTTFTPDGSRYIKAIPRNGLYIFDFDRCTGTLSNSIFIAYDTIQTNLTGAAVSPNSRYLYLPIGGRIFQYDLQATDINASRQTVAEYDGFLSPDPTGMYQATLAPDGKIYIGTNGLSDILHVIRFPDRPGQACQVEQHSLQLLSQQFYLMPNFPHYRLGPLDASACDTLGLDNHPVANFRHDFEDSTNTLQVTFTSLAYGEPETWSWSFGDGTAASSDTSPVHIYTAPGLYNVCQTVANTYGVDTICKLVDVDFTTALPLQPPLQLPLQTWPNPARDRFTVLTGAPPGLRQRGTLYNALGQAVARQTWLGDSAAWEVGGLPAGWYLLEVTTDDGRRGATQVLAVGSLR